MGWFAPNFAPKGKMLAFYDSDLHRGILPAHLQDPGGLNFWQRRRVLKMRQEFLDSIGGVLAVGGGDDYSWFRMLEPYYVTDSTPVTAAAETALTFDPPLAMPAWVFAFPGKMLWTRCMGKQSNVVTTPGTYLFKLKWSTPAAGIGATTGTQLVLSGAIAPNPVAVTDNVFYVEAFAQCRAQGPSTTGLTLMTNGEVFLANTNGAAADQRNAAMPPGGTALADVASLDQTIAKAFTFTVTPSVATGSITARKAWIVAMN